MSFVHELVEIRFARCISRTLLGTSKSSGCFRSSLKKLRVKRSDSLCTVGRCGAREQEADLSVDIDHFLHDPEVAAAFEDAQARTALLDHLVAARKRLSGQSQAQIAALMETTQSAVSDLESGGTDPRLSTLQRYARATGHRLNVSLTAATQTVGVGEQGSARASAPGG